MRPPPPPAPDISQNVSSPTTVRLGLLLMNFPRFQPATRKKTKRRCALIRSSLRNNSALPVCVEEVKPKIQ
jgi:hypothetical protein